MDFNGARAVVAAGYSATSARQHASDMLKLPHIKAAVDAGRAKLTEKTEVTVLDVVRGFKEIAVDDAAPHAARVSAWTQLGRHLGMFVDKTENKNTNDGKFNITVVYEDKPPKQELPE